MSNELEITARVDLAFPYPRYIRKGSCIVCVSEGETPEISQANAERIVRSWACHDDLYNALKERVNQFWMNYSNTENESFRRLYPEHPIIKAENALLKANPNYIKP